ncbi:MAG: class I SAM-dependent methyltransferase [Chthoniobacterales bacterium]
MFGPILALMFVWWMLPDIALTWFVALYAALLLGIAALHWGIAFGISFSAYFVSGDRRVRGTSSAHADHLTSTRSLTYVITGKSGFTWKERLRALRSAPSGTRIKLLLEFLRHSSKRRPVSTAEVCEFAQLTNYEADYLKLAALLGRPGNLAPPGEIDFLHRMMTRPHSAGAISSSDYLFLTAFTSILAPFHVVEVGTLTGFSAAILAAALYRRHGAAGSVRVDTIDIQRQCLIDPTKLTGFELNELIPELARSVSVHTPHDSRMVSKLARRDELELAFIDADHQHPRPLLDLVRLAPHLRSNGWVILHDTQLRTESAAIPNAERLQWGNPAGAEWLFAHWPFRKISGGNIGALQLPKDKSELVSFALHFLQTPSEVQGESGARARREVLYSLGALLS